MNAPTAAPSAKSELRLHEDALWLNSASRPLPLLSPTPASSKCAETFAIAINKGGVPFFLLIAKYDVSSRAYSRRSMKKNQKTAVAREPARANANSEGEAKSEEPVENRERSGFCMCLL